MSVQAKHGGPLSEEEFRKFTLYMNGSNNREDDQERARILGFTAEGIRVAPGAVVRVSDSASIHRDVYIGLYSYINGDVTLHPKVLVGPQVSIVGSNHRYSPEDDCFSARTDPVQGRVVIEHGVWLTTGVVVTPGCTIGRCSLVCANSVVTSDIPPYTIVAGSPASKIGEIDRHTGDYRWMRED
ncbi:acyltransferase [Halomonas litopenaei]|uniref:acyltransferase n=1 Tax=Halomonas litopenaei TaxID=2109328 RepID=UPI003F9ECEA9